MKRNEALPGKYLAKEDFDPPRVVEIQKVAIEEIEGGGSVENKPILYFKGSRRGIVLNGTNWDLIVKITGKDDSDDWYGAQIEVYHDPSIRFGPRKVGGIRVRAPQTTGAVNSAPEDDEPDGEYDPADPPF